MSERNRAEDRQLESSYLLAVKDNQPTLAAAVTAVFDEALLDPGFSDAHHQTVDGGHGRTEIRRCWTLAVDAECGSPFDQWPMLKGIVRVEAERTVAGKTSTEHRYYITSRSGLSAKSALAASRSHWGIENQLHWVLDVGFREDDCRVRVGNAAQNFAVIRRVALNLLKRFKGASRRTANSVCTTSAFLQAGTVATCSVSWAYIPSHFDAIALGRIMTRAVALMTASEAASLLKESGVAQVSKATLDRLPKAIAARYEGHRDTINAALRERETVPDAAVVVQVALDGVMVPQDGEHAQARGRKAEVNAPPRHERRYGASTGTPPPAANDGEHGRAWHEATVGTVAFWDCEGKHLKTLYVGRMPEAGQATVASDLELELHLALDQRPDLDVCFASDGDAQQWKLLDALSTSVPESSTRTVRYLLDFYHAATYVHEAANAVLEEAAAKVQAEHWKATLKEHPDGAERVSSR